MVDLNGHEAGNGGYSQRTPNAHRGSSTRRSDGDVKRQTQTLRYSTTRRARFAGAGASFNLGVGWERPLPLLFDGYKNSSISSIRRSASWYPMSMSARV